MHIACLRSQYDLEADQFCCLLFPLARIEDDCKQQKTLKEKPSALRRKHEVDCGLEKTSRRHNYEAQRILSSSSWTFLERFLIKSSYLALGHVDPPTGGELTKAHRVGLHAVKETGTPTSCIIVSYSLLIKVHHLNTQR